MNILTDKFLKYFLCLVALLFIVIVVPIPAELNGISVEYAQRDSGYIPESTDEVSIYYSFGDDFSEFNRIHPRIIYNGVARFTLPPSNVELKQIRIDLAGEDAAFGISSIKLLFNGQTIVKIQAKDMLHYFSISSETGGTLENGYLGFAPSERTHSLVSNGMLISMLDHNIQTFIILQKIKYGVIAAIVIILLCFWSIRREGKTREVDDALTMRFYKYLCISLIVKILFMPFFAHPDFFSMWGRVYNMVSVNYFMAQDVNFINYILHCAYMMFIRNFIPNLDAIFYLEDFYNNTVQLSERYLGVISEPSIFACIFFLKIFFLFFDIFVSLILFKVLYRTNKTKGFYVSTCWALNPIIFYTLYLFGRFEVIPVFFCLMVFLALKNNHFLLSCCAMTLLVSSREFFLVLLPLFFLSILPVQELRISRIMAGLGIVIGGYVGPIILPRLIGLEPLYQQKNVLQFSQKDHFFDSQIAFIYPIISIFFVIAILLLFYRRGTPFNRFLYSGFLFCSAYFAFSWNSPHYFSWFVLFVLLTISGKNEIRLNVVFYLMWFVFFLFSPDSGMFTQFLAAPLSAKLSVFPIVATIYTKTIGSYVGISLETAIQILQTCLFTIIAMQSIYILKRVCGESEKN